MGKYFKPFRIAVLFIDGFKIMRNTRQEKQGHETGRYHSEQPHIGLPANFYIEQAVNSYQCNGQTGIQYRSI
ncbi:hypothetical protein D3C87_1295630 [compost metagenome]